MLVKAIFSPVRYSGPRGAILSLQNLFCTESPAVVTPESAQVESVRKSLPEKFLNERKAIFERYPADKTPYKPRQAWVETLSSGVWNSKHANLIELHPEVWSVRPR
jgi:hypothetical protein